MHVAPVYPGYVTKDVTVHVGTTDVTKDVAVQVDTASVEGEFLAFEHDLILRGRAATPELP